MSELRRVGRGAVRGVVPQGAERVKRLRQLVRPTYGRWVQVTPKRWWSRKERRIARLAAVVADHQAQEIIDRSVESLIYGEGFRR